MTASLTPQLTLDFLTALSADVRAAAVLDHAGARLAGPPALAASAAALPREAGHFEGVSEAGTVFAAGDARHTLVVIAGAYALPRLTRHDLGVALCALGGQTPPIGPPRRLPDALVTALLNAA